MVRVASHVAMGLAILAMAVAPAWGQAAQEDVKKELETLKAKVAALEAQKTGEPAPITFAPDEDGAKALGFLEQVAAGVKISGFVDAGYNFNMERPADNTNRFRAFDTAANSFAIHNAQLTLEKGASKDAIAGFKVELMMGSDASITELDPLLGDGDVFDVQEAYVEILAPWGNGVNIKVGKFATLAGYEVIESKDNYNYSRSFLFTWAIPFTHTGVRATYMFSDQICVCLGFNNGWDNMIDSDDGFTQAGNGKTLELQLMVKPIDWLTGIVNIYAGKEDSGTAPSGDATRQLVDIVVTANVPNTTLTLGINYDMASEEDGVVGASGLEDADWSGFAVYAKYGFTDTISGAVRFEVFDDEDNFRTGAGPLSAGATGHKLTSITATAEFKLAKDLIFRLEVRQDSSDEDVFIDNDSLAEDGNMTLGAEVIFTF
jgi:hypothetical protein